MTKSQLIRRIEQLEAEMVANRGVEFIITNETVDDNERKIIVVFSYEIIETLYQGDIQND